MDGDDDLAVGGRRAGNVSGELVDVRDDEGAVLRPRLTTDSTVIGDSRTCNGTLKWSKDQFGVGVGIGFGFYDVEAGPEEVEGIMEDGDDVGHISDEVGFAGDEGLDLREDGLV